MPRELRLIGLTTIPEVRRGDDVAALIVEAAAREGVGIEDGDVAVVASKIVSKAGGYGGAIADVRPGLRAEGISALTGKDPVETEIVLRNSRDVLGCLPVKWAERRFRVISSLSPDGDIGDLVEEEPCLLLTVEGNGRLSTDAGLDYSNAAPGEYVLPPPDPDAEARRIAEGVRALTGARIAVVLSDTEFIPSRAIGTMDVAIGCHRVPTVRMGMGRPDRYGRRKFGGVDMTSNEIAAAAALLMGQTDEGVPVVLVRGLGLAGDGPAAGPGPGLTPEIIRGGLLRIVFSWLLVKLAPVVGAIVSLGRAPRGSTPRWARREGGHAP
jgi:coenzyme F420-0:L-glutamate ligase/coenzyme F420-1:gamma-L-glutamate ligase